MDEQTKNTDNVTYLPVWKEGATAEERLAELSMMARKHPEWFAKLMVVYIEELQGSTKLRWVSNGMTTYEVVGALVDAQRNVLSGES